MKTHSGYRFDYERWSSDMYNARKGRGLSQYSVGYVVGKTKATISRYESLKVFPEVTDFLALCYFFDFNPMTYLIIGDDIQKTAFMFDSLLESKRREQEVIPLS